MPAGVLAGHSDRAGFVVHSVGLIFLFIGLVGLIVTRRAVVMPDEAKTGFAPHVTGLVSSDLPRRKASKDFAHLRADLRYCGQWTELGVAQTTLSLHRR